MLCAVLGVGLSVWQRRGEEAAVRSMHGKRSECGACGHSACFECRGPWHPGLPCGFQASDEATVRAWAVSNSKDVARCPQCRVVIERSAGCNHLQWGLCSKGVLLALRVRLERGRLQQQLRAVQRQAGREAGRADHGSLERPRRAQEAAALSELAFRSPLAPRCATAQHLSVTGRECSPSAASVSAVGCSGASSS